jgi:biopolymer transport protein ExbB
MKNPLALIFISAALTASVSADETAPTMTALVVDVFAAGGSMMWALLATSLIGLTFALERLVALQTRKHLPTNLAAQISELRKTRDRDAALAAAQASRSTLGRVFAALLSHQGQPRNEIETAIEDELNRVVADERRNIRPIGIAATSAPLIGLLGTVLGLIAAFREASTSGMDDPTLFAGGIYQALYTTAYGLIISLGLLMLFHYLRGRVEKIARAVEDTALAAVHEDFYLEPPLAVIAEVEAA